MHTERIRKFDERKPVIYGAAMYVSLCQPTLSEGHSLTMISVGSGSFGPLLTAAIVQLLTINKHQNLIECIDNYQVLF